MSGRACEACGAVKGYAAFRQGRSVCRRCEGTPEGVPRPPGPYIVDFWPLWPAPPKVMPGHASKNKGEASGRALLTERRVADIRARLAAGASHSAIARAFGVSKSTITRINRRQTWT